MKYKLVASDFDDTMVDDSLVIGEKTKSAIKIKLSLINFTIIHNKYLHSLLF